MDSQNHTMLFLKQNRDSHLRTRPSIMLDIETILTDLTKIGDMAKEVETTIPQINPLKQVMVNQPFKEVAHETDTSTFYKYIPDILKPKTKVSTEKLCDGEDEYCKIEYNYDNYTVMYIGQLFDFGFGIRKTDYKRHGLGVMTYTYNNIQYKYAGKWRGDTFIKGTYTSTPVNDKTVDSASQSSDTNTITKCGYFAKSKINGKYDLNGMGSYCYNTQCLISQWMYGVPRYSRFGNDRYMNNVLFNASETPRPEKLHNTTYIQGNWMIRENNELPLDNNRPTFENNELPLDNNQHTGGRRYKRQKSNRNRNRLRKKIKSSRRRK
jgi:hypothetical protein